MSDLQIDDRGFIMTCPSCAQRNRVAFSARESRCGRCKTPLTAASEPIEVSDSASFDALVREPLADRGRLLGAVVRPVPNGRARDCPGGRLERRSIHRRQGQYGCAAGARGTLPHPIDSDDGDIRGEGSRPHDRSDAGGRDRGFVNGAVEVS